MVERKSEHERMQTVDNHLNLLERGAEGRAKICARVLPDLYNNLKSRGCTNEQAWEMTIVFAKAFLMSE